MKLFFNADFYTMQSPGALKKAVLVEEETVVDVLDSVPLGFGGEKIDLQNAFVLPGLTDTHTHSFEGGLYALGCDLGQAKSIAQVLEMLSEMPQNGNTLFAFNFDENAIKENRFPTASELDAIFPASPVLLRRVDGHSCVINSFAAQKISKLVAIPKPFSGLLKGADQDRAVHYFQAEIDAEGVINAYKKAEEIAFKNGITSLHTMIGDALYDERHYALMDNSRHLFALDWILYPQILDVKKAAALGSERVGGCILADGSFGSHTAGLLTPYADQPSNYGKTYQSDEFWQNFFEEATSCGLSACVHAIGDRAISQLISAIEAAEAKYPANNIRHEIIHGELVNDTMLERIARTKAALVMQPAFDYYWGGVDNLYKKVLGEKRALKTNRLADFTRAGVLVSGGSDWYVTPLDALLGIKAALKMHSVGQSLSLPEAISLYTVNAAMLIDKEDSEGKIDRGYKADFTVLSASPLDPTCYVKATYKKGKQVYAA